MNGPQPSGIVLAGGQSSRFGADKLAATIGGRPLLHLAIEAVAGICCEVVVVVGPDGVPDLPRLGVPLRIARDATSGGGPLVGLVAGLDEAGSVTAIVVGGDMPALMPAVLDELARRAAEGSGAVALMDGDRARPLPCALPREAALTAARELLATGHSRLRDLLDAVGLTAIPEAEWRPFDPAGRSLVDVDRPEDLEQARGR